MGLVFPVLYPRKKLLDNKREITVSRKEAVKQLTLRNKIFLRTEIPSFRSKNE